MTLFVLSAALLTLLALGVLTRSLWHRGDPERASSAGAIAIAALRMQLEQLKSLNQSGALGDAPYAQAREPLERRLVELVVDTTAPAAPVQRPAAIRSQVLLLSLFVGGVALAGYAVLGTPQALDAGPDSAAVQAGGAHAVTPDQIEAMVAGLAARLKERPDDADGWAMLGRSYAVLGRRDEALPALRKAVELRGDDAQLLADYADALAVANGRTLEGEPARLIARALEIDPNHLKALSLAGTLAFDLKDYAGAIRHWEQMVRQAPASELTQQIQGGIDEARLRMGADAPPWPQASTASAAVAASALSGTVSLAPALAAQARPDDTVFVFARAAEGPRMPLAILRKQVRDLPFTFTLDDSQAMSPAARLSSAARVVVGARISKGGGATPQPGDLQGFSATVASGASQVKVEITEVVGR